MSIIDHNLRGIILCKVQQHKHIDHNLRGIIPLQGSATQTQNVIPMGK